MKKKNNTNDNGTFSLDPLPENMPIPLQKEVLTEEVLAILRAQKDREATYWQAVADAMRELDAAKRLHERGTT